MGFTSDRTGTGTVTVMNQNPRDPVAFAREIYDIYRELLGDDRASWDDLPGEERRAWIVIAKRCLGFQSPM
jgi:hypothetical protein